MFYQDSNDEEGLTMAPEIGMLCLMDQEIEHEVPHLQDGIKYAIRTELMYKN